MTDTKPRTLTDALITSRALNAAMAFSVPAESGPECRALIAEDVTDHLRAQATDPDVIATIKERIYTPHVVGGSAVIEATLKAFVETLGGGTDG